MSDTAWNSDGERDDAFAQEEGCLLMSLALDGMLGADDEDRLQAMLAQDDSLDETWRQWQKVDALFTNAWHVAPPVGFVARFEEKVQVNERRALARRRAVLATVTTVVWLGAAVALVAVLAILWANQTQWMSDFVRELVYYPSAVSIWLRAVRSSLSATVSEPQSIAMVCGYAASAAVLLAGWFWLLRRTTHEEVVS